MENMMDAPFWSQVWGFVFNIGSALACLIRAATIPIAVAHCQSIPVVAAG
jgi:hypothetical protein